MGGVDIADQLRGYYNCQLTVRRTWLPLFFWMLDTVLVNCVIIYRKVTNSNISSKDFRITLAWELIRDALGDGKKNESQELQAPSKRKRIIVNKNFELPLTRLLGGDHLVEWRQKREACVYCHYLAQYGKKSISYDNPPQSNLWCAKCNVPLCVSKARPHCFKIFHSKNNKEGLYDSHIYVYSSRDGQE